jgi:hypothetical protein
LQQRSSCARASHHASQGSAGLPNGHRLEDGFLLRFDLFDAYCWA